MTIQSFVNQLFKAGGVIQFRDIDKCTVDYTMRTRNKQTFVTKMKWEGSMHNVTVDNDIPVEDAVKEIIDRVERSRK